jgi:hypothetical protein
MNLLAIFTRPYCSRHVVFGVIVAPLTAGRETFAQFDTIDEFPGGCVAQ